MRLYLAQHGLAVDKSIDPDRPLSEQGINDVQRMASFLKTAGASPDQIFHSGKTRAQQTAEIFASTLDGIKPGILENISPNDPLASACNLVSKQAGDTMLVGHLPFMQRLVSFLLNDNEDTGYNFQPGSVVCLNKSDGGWEMDWMIRPDLISD